MYRPHMPIILLLLVLILGGCSSTQTPPKQRTAEDVFRDAKTALDDDDLIQAASLFDIIKLQYPASQYADDAQYYLAEINFRKGEFILAAFNYSMVRRAYPNSDFAKEALFKSAVCYLELSPPYDRDQEYTKKAIQAFSEFQAVYPTDSLSLKALDHIGSLRSKLAQRYFTIAEQYVTLGSMKGAVVYYDAVIEEYPDTHFYEDALVGKMTAQQRLKKYDDLRTTIARYRGTVKSGKRGSEVDQIEKELP